MGGIRWNTHEEITLREGQSKRRPLHMTVQRLGRRTYGATKTWASMHRIWQMPRWSENDKSYLLFLLRQNTPFEHIKYAFPERSVQGIRNQILRAKEFI